MSRPDFVFFRHIVKLNPRAVLAIDDALGAKNAAVFPGVQGGENLLDIRLGEGPGSFPAPGGKDLGGMVVVMVAGAAGVAALVAMVVVVPVFL